jgi:tetratricopeptide (TPR) repeat protein
MSKKKKANKRRGKPRSLDFMPRKMQVKLVEASDLLDRRQFEEAREILDELNKQYPRRVEVLAELAFACAELHDYPSYLRAAKDLVDVAPRADFVLSLAGAYLTNVFPVLALRTFQRFLERWPDHPRAAEARQMAADLEREMPKLMEGLAIAGEDAREILVLHEEMQVYLARGQYDRVRQAGEELLKRRPHFAAAFNNMAEAAFRQGQTNEAIALSRRLLELGPNNVHGLSNLTRYFLLNGQADEARTMAERLKLAEAKGWDPWTKKAEALSHLGDDSGVLDVLRAFKQTGKEAGPHEALLHHLAAVAAYRLGREGEAREHWKEALRQMPGLGLARDNIDDLDQPVGQRHGPWAFSIGNWIPDRTIRELSAAFGPPGQRKKKPSEGNVLRRYLQEHPALASLVPLVLDRGDPHGRTFALNLAKTARTPELLAALRDFALGQRGPDQQRVEAANVASEAGVLARGNVRMWVEGEWREIMLMGWEIHNEPSSKHSPRIQSLAQQAGEALYEDQLVRAEQLYKQALELEPDSPDLLNNLAQAYEGQGRHAEAEALMRQVHQRFPDYFFGRISVAQLLAHEGKLDEARELLLPLMQRQRLHSSEFRALCHAQIEIALEAGERQAAESWLGIWQGIEPDHPMLEHDRRRVSKPGVLQRMRGLLK